MKTRAVLALFVLVLVVSTAGAESDESLTPADRAALADKLAASLVRVEYTLRFDKGEAPQVAGVGERCPNCLRSHGVYAAEYVKEERPLETGGYLLSDNEVITSDPMVHPRFVKQIAVRFGDEVVKAEISRYAKMQGGVILKLEKPLSGAKPLVFDAKKKSPYLAVTYLRNGAIWQVHVSSLPGAVTTTASKRRFRATPTHCVIIDSKGAPVGMSMKSEVSLDDSWKGSPLQWPMVSADEMSKMLSALEAVVGGGLMRVTLNFRSPKKDARESFDRDGQGAVERHVSGILLDDKTILVLASMKAKITARLERITVHPPKGDAVSAKFKDSLRDYGAFIAALDKPLKGALTLSSEDVLKCKDRLLPMVEIRIQGERRTKYVMHSRISSYDVGWKNQVYPEIRGSDESVFLFDLRNRLLVLPIVRREKVAVEERWSSGTPTMTPVAHLVPVLADVQKHADANNIPLSEEEENRIAWMGVELQALDKELARANNVSHLTRDGAMGALVSYVYAGSPADKAGIKMGFILLRLHSPDQPKPIDVTMRGMGGRWGAVGFPWDKLDELPEQYYDRIPAPWLPVENSFTRALTDLGFGKKYSAEFFSEGLSFRKEFVVTQSPPHYGSAPRYKSKSLGLTVRDLTYEVRRLLQKKPDDPGVVISKIETGSKASVSGLKPFEMITHVNDKPVFKVKDFETLITGQQELRLSVLRMTQSRLVKIKMAAPKKADDSEGEPGKKEGEPAKPAPEDAEKKEAPREEPDKPAPEDAEKEEAPKEEPVEPPAPK